MDQDAAPYEGVVYHWSDIVLDVTRADITRFTPSDIDAVRPSGALSKTIIEVVGIESVACEPYVAAMVIDIALDLEYCSTRCGVGCTIGATNSSGVGTGLQVPFFARGRARRRGCC